MQDVYIGGCRNPSYIHTYLLMELGGPPMAVQIWSLWRFTTTGAAMELSGLQGCQRTDELHSQGYGGWAPFCHCSPAERNQLTEQ